MWGLRDDTLTLHLEPYGNLDPPQRYGLDGVVLVSPGGTSAVRRCAGCSAKVPGIERAVAAHHRPVADQVEVAHHDLGALNYRHLVLPPHRPPPREARFQTVQEAADTLDLYLCQLPPERPWREQGSMNAAVVQASAWVSVVVPQAAVAEVLAVQEVGS